MKTSSSITPRPSPLLIEPTDVVAPVVVSISTSVPPDNPNSMESDAAKPSETDDEVVNERTSAPEL